MDFHFESPNTQPSLLKVSTADQFLSNMATVNPNPPQYDQRTINDVALTAELDKFDKLDAYYLAEKKFQESANKYASSQTAINFHNNIKHQKQ